MRALGLDYGGKTIGVAVSDPFLVTAVGLETIRRPGEEALKKSVFRLGELIRQYEVDKIVLGYPKHLDNTESARSIKTLAFLDKLKRNFKNMEIVLWDERFSSAAAYKELSAAGVKPGKIRAINDETAAVVILQNYLDYLNNAKKTAQ